MKKTLILFCVCVLSGAVCTSCIKEFSDNFWRWGIKNNTGHTIILRIPDKDNKDQEPDYNTLILCPDNAEFLLTTTTRSRIELSFNDYFKRTIERLGEDVSWQILSEDGSNVLKTWVYSERDLPGQRFFNESSWVFEQWKGHGGHEHLWIFEISPEDIIQ